VGMATASSCVHIKRHQIVNSIVKPAATSPISAVISVGCLAYPLLNPTHHHIAVQMMNNQVVRIHYNTSDPSAYMLIPSRITKCYSAVYAFRLDTGASPPELPAEPGVPGVDDSAALTGMLDEGDSSVSFAFISRKW